MSQQEPQHRPLDDIVVLDLGQVYNGPYCGLLLGFMGARIVKIEPPRGDLIRHERPRSEDRFAYIRLNSNKESIVIDLKRSEGRELFLKLADKADVLIENFTVGVMDRLGIGWETLRARNRRLIFASGKGFGLTGPYRDYPAMDVTVQAMSGALNATGYPDQPPVKAGPAMTDFLGGVHLCAGILAAVLQREKTGEGQLVEVSMHETAVMALNSALAAFVDKGPGVVPERTGNRPPNLEYSPYNLYPASDGYVAIFCVGDRHWQALAKIIGREELIEDPKFATRIERSARVDEVDEIVGGWTSARSRDEIERTLNGAGVPSASVKTVGEVAVDRHLVEREAIVEVEHPSLGSLSLPTSPIRLHGARPKKVDRLAPSLGQDTDRVLTDLLGLDEAEIARLHECGAVEPEIPTH